MGLLDKFLEKWKQQYIEENAAKWKEEIINKNREEWMQQTQTSFLQERSEEAATARDAIIFVLKELQVSLPGACFALDLVKAELVRAQLEEFLGNVKLTKSLPLSPQKS